MASKKGTRRSSHRQHRRSSTRRSRSQRGGGMHKIYVYRNPGNPNISPNNIMTTPGLLVPNAPTGSITGGMNMISINAAAFNKGLGKLKGMMVKVANPAGSFMPVSPRAINQGGPSIAIESIKGNRLCAGTRRCKMPVQTDMGLNEIDFSVTGLKIRNLDTANFGNLNPSVPKSKLDGPAVGAPSGPASIGEPKYNICIELAFE